METKILSTTEEDLRVAGNILKNGGLVAFPTETVYGLGANALDRDACKKVYLAKGRPSDNPMIVHIANKEEIYSLSDEISNDVKLLMDCFFPGPLTIVLKAKDIVPRITTGGLDTVAVRMPSNEIANKLIRYSGVPIAAPSANLSGKPSPTKASHCVDDLTGKVDAIIMGPECEVGIESTVIDMTGDIPIILRPGIITLEEISLALDKEVVFDKALFEKPGKDFKPKAPGMKYKHYAPNATMILFKGEKDLVRKKIEEVKLEKESEGLKVSVILFSDEKTAAHDLFDRLRVCDKENVDLILCETLNEDGIGFSVMNRMLKSASYNVYEVKGKKDMIIALAADHGGYELKNAIKEHLEGRGINTLDLGTNSSESVDYPLYGKACAEAVISKKADLGIVCCGTGIGISIAANKVKGIRCGLCTSVEMATLTKQHNNANMIALGGRTTSKQLALDIVDAWLDNEFMGKHHVKRIEMLEEIF